jgi:RNA polymerase sigma-70 factor (ECF subfamily)
MDADPLLPLVEAARRGDQGAFLAMVERVHDPIRRSVALRTGDPAVIDEVVQRTLISAWQGLPRFAARCPVIVWMRAIALNHLRKELRTRSRGPQRDLDALLAQEDLRALEDDDEDRLVLLRRCLERLGAGVRRILDLRYRDGLEHDPIAAQTGRSPALVATHLHRARKTLRSCIEQGAAP